jgi:hypothetical protein
MAEYTAEQGWWRFKGLGNVWMKSALVYIALFLASIPLPLPAPVHLIVGGTLAVVGLACVKVGVERCHSKARLQLLRALSLIRAEDARKLGALHWKRLYRHLRGTDVVMASTILKVILRCGNTEALRYVEPLARGKGAAKWDASLRTLAQSCEQQLKERNDRLDAPQNLLRASECPGSQELLRAAGEKADGTPQQLLRASDKQDDASR